MAKEKGWIKIHRKMMDSEGYFREPFCRNMAWIDLLLLANHKPTTERKRGIKVSSVRGEITQSARELGERWNWSKNKVLHFLELLEDEGQLTIKKSNITSVITIVNYDYYQGSETDAQKEVSHKKDTKRTQIGTRKGTHSGTQNNDSNTSLSDNYNSKSENVGTQTETHLGTDDFSKSGHKRDTDLCNGLENNQLQAPKNDKNIKNSKEEINRGEGDLQPLHASPPAFAVIKAIDGSLVKVPSIEYKPENFNGLPDNYAIVIMNNIKSVKKIEVEKERLTAAWETFKVLEMHKKLYRNKEDVYSFFSNYCKRQSWKGEKEKVEKPKQQKKVGKVVGVKWLNDFTHCEMSDGTIQKLDINEQDSARYNLINPSSIVKSN